MWLIGTGETLTHLCDSYQNMSPIACEPAVVTAPPPLRLLICQILRFFWCCFWLLAVRCFMGLCITMEVSTEVKEFKTLSFLFNEFEIKQDKVKENHHEASRWEGERALFCSEGGPVKTKPYYSPQYDIVFTEMTCFSTRWLSFSKALSFHTGSMWKYCIRKNRKNYPLKNSGIQLIRHFVATELQEWCDIFGNMPIGYHSGS